MTTAAFLVSMSAATIDRRLADERAKSHSSKDVAHQAGIAAQKSDPGPHLGRLGRREAGLRRDRLGLPRRRKHRRAIRIHPHGHRYRHGLDREPLPAHQEAKCVLAALETSPTRCRSRSWGWTATTEQNSSTSICSSGVKNRAITFTRSRPANKNDGCHVEQKNWAVVRTLVGYYRYDTASELLLLNEIWQPTVHADQLLPPAAETDIQSPRQAPRCPRNTTPPLPRFTARSITRA